MPTVKIKYVGHKADGERAFKADTEIEWFPGDVHDVDKKVAEQMLRHPDVFEQVDGDPVKAAPAPTFKAVASDQDEVDDEAIAREAAAKEAKEEAETKAAHEAAAKSKQVDKPQQSATPAAKRALKAPSSQPRVKAKKK